MRYANDHSEQVLTELGLAWLVAGLDNSISNELTNSGKNPCQMSQSIRITIIGGEGLFQDALAESLARQPDFRVVGVFVSVEKALPLLRVTQASVLLMALDFDEQTGAAAATQARAAGFRGGVLIVTS